MSQDLQKQGRGGDNTRSRTELIAALIGVQDKIQFKFCLPPVSKAISLIISAISQVTAQSLALL